MLLCVTQLERALSILIQYNTLVCYYNDIDNVVYHEQKSSKFRCKGMVGHVTLDWMFRNILYSVRQLVRC